MPEGLNAGDQAGRMLVVHRGSTGAIIRVTVPLNSPPGTVLHCSPPTCNAPHVVGLDEPSELAMKPHDMWSANHAQPVQGACSTNVDTPATDATATDVGPSESSPTPLPLASEGANLFTGLP